MPVYEYECQKCGKRFTLALSLAAHGRQKASCPKCKSAKVTQLFSGFFAQTSRKS